MNSYTQILYWYAGAGLTAYLLGAIPCGFLIARAKGVDIRKVGSGNIGATNVFRTVGKTWGILTFACDALKGFAPVYLLPRIVAFLVKPELSAGITDGLAICCAAMAVVGHNWPVYLGFRGGKGVATSAGALLALAPGAMGVGLLAWLMVFTATRYVSMASISAAGAVAGAGWFLATWPTALLLTILSAAIIWRHKTNIQRLREGTEYRFNFRKPPTDGND